MKIEKNMLDEHLQKIKDYICALKWWADNLREPLVNGEYILFHKIIDDMSEEFKKITKEIKQNESTKKE